MLHGRFCQGTVLSAVCVFIKEISAHQRYPDSFVSWVVCVLVYPDIVSILLKKELEFFKISTEEGT